MSGRHERKAPGAGEQTGRELIAAAQYAALALLANVFAAPFWFFERRRWRLADRLDNEGNPDERHK
jgi:hypothetical protein